MDPLELRLKNAAKEGDRMSNGVPHPRFGCSELEEAMMSHPHYTAPLDGPNRGRGVAVGFRWQGGQTSSATINVNSDGSIALITGSVDIGGTRVAVAQQAAEVLERREQILSQTATDARRIKVTAERDARHLVDDSELAASAKRRGEEIIREAEERAYKIVAAVEADALGRRRGADEYIREALSMFELEPA